MNGRATWTTRLLQCFVAAVIACTGFVAHAQSTSFGLLNPSPSPAALYDIQAVGSKLYAVGGQCTLVMSPDGGKTWVQQRGDNNALTSFRDVFFPQAGGKGWAVGGWQRIRPADTVKAGVAEWTNDGGATWTREILQQATCLNGVTFPSGSQGYAVGRGRDPGNFYANEKAYTFITTDGGQTWSRQTRFNGVNNASMPGVEFKSVAFANTSTGFMIGGAFGGAPGLRYTPDGTSLWMTSNSGTDWWTSPQVGTLPVGTTLSQVCPIDLTHAYMCGSVGNTAAIFYSSDGGNSWLRQTNGFPSTQIGNLYSMTFTSANIGYAVGYKWSGTDTNVLFYKTINAGNSWVEMDPHVSLSAIDGRVFRMTASDDNNIYLAGRGDGAMVWASNDGGSTWMAASYNAASFGWANPQLSDISFSTVASGWAVGLTNSQPGNKARPVIVHTMDSGMTWRAEGPTGIFGSLNGVAAVSGSEAWAGGVDNFGNTTLWHTMDNGNTWFSANPSSLGIFGTIYDIAFAVPANGYGVMTTSTNNYYTRNGGQSWTAATNVSNQHPTRIGTYYGRTIWAVLANGLETSVDSGKTWTYIPSNDARFNNANTYTFEGISFAPTNDYGWVSGWETQVGTPLPVAYIAATTDGGATWKQQSYFRLPNTRYTPGVSPIPFTDSMWVNDTKYQFNDVNDILALAPNAALAVTSLNYNAINNTGANWTNIVGGVGTRLMATTNGGGTWYEIDSSFQGTQYARLSGALTNRIDAFGVGAQGMIRHGFLNIPELATSPDTLFRNIVLSVNPTDSAYDTVTIRNVGSAPMTILNIAFVNDPGDPADPLASRPDLDYTLVSAPGLPLNAGDVGTIVVKFKPRVFAPRYATIQITTNSVTAPIKNIGLRGVGGLSVAMLSPSTLFIKDTVAIDNVNGDSATIYISNPGTRGVHGVLEVGAIVLLDSTLTNSYAIKSFPTKGIQPRSMDSIVVYFRPRSGGNKRGSVTISTNARDYPSFVVTLGGVGGVRTLTADTMMASFTDTVSCSGTAKCFRIKNTGTQVMRIDSAVINLGGKTEYTVSALTNIVLAPGVDTQLCVTHTPTMYGARMDSIVVYSNAMNMPKASFMLNGLGKQEFLSFNARTFLATVPCGQTFDTSVIVFDTGNIGVHITPLLSLVPSGWELIIGGTKSFPQYVTSQDSFFIRHDVANTHKLDTMKFVLTWNDKKDNSVTCVSTLHYDTLTFIYDVCPTIIGVRDAKQVATHFDLMQNYPNPFNPTTTIEYAVPEYSNVTLTVFNSLGQAVRVLENTVHAPGVYKSTFDASELPSGNYYYELKAGSFTKRMMMTMTK